MVEINYREVIEMEWELNPNNENGSWYLWGERGKGKLLGSLIRPDKNENEWGVSVYTSAGGLVFVGKIPEDEFDLSVAQSIVVRALNEDKTFEWWCNNACQWWRANTAIG